MEAVSAGQGGLVQLLTPLTYGAFIVLCALVLTICTQFRTGRNTGVAITFLLSLLLVDGIRMLAESLIFFGNAPRPLGPSVGGSERAALIPGMFGVVSGVLVVVYGWLVSPLRAHQRQDRIRRLEEEVDRRKRAERALAQAFLKQDSLLQAIPDIVFMLDTRGRLQKWNRKGEQEVGKGATELSGALAARLIHVDDRPEVGRMMAECRERGESEIEARLVTPGSRAVAYAWKAVARWDLDGRFVGVSGIGRNLTGRKRFEQVLRDERNFTSSVLESIPSLVVVIDREGRITRFNKACEDVSGYRFEDVHGRPIWEKLFAPEEVQFLKDFLEAMKRGMGDEGCERYWITRDGRRRLIAWSHSTLASSGRLDYVICTGTDITERRRAERALHQRLVAEEALSDFSSRFIGTLHFKWALREVMKDVVKLTGASCVCLTESPEDGPCRFLYRNGPVLPGGACSLEPVANGEWLERLRDGDIVLAERKSVRPRRETVSHEEDEGVCSVLIPLFVADEFFGWVGLRGMESGQIWCEGDCALLRLLARILSGALVRRAAEEQNERLIKENRQLARRTFAIQERERANLARELHDELGQSITAIRADVESIRRWSCDAHPHIHASAEAIAEVSDDVYRLIKDMMGRLRPAMLDELGLIAALREYVVEWNRRYPEVHCNLVAPEEPERLGRMSRIVAFRVVQEALTNVARHSRARYVELHVNIQGEGERRMLEVIICDDGVGMDVEKAPRGLGLLGMRERVLALDGRFDVQAEHDRGVTVRALLPTLD